MWENGKKKSYQLCGESCQLVKLERSGEELSPFSVGSVALVNKGVDCLLCCDDLLLSKYVWLLVPYFVESVYVSLHLIMLLF